MFILDLSNILNILQDANVVFAHGYFLLAFTLLQIQVYQICQERLLFLHCCISCTEHDALTPSSYSSTWCAIVANRMQDKSFVSTTYLHCH